MPNPECTILQFKCCTFLVYTVLLFSLINHLKKNSLRNIVQLKTIYFAHFNFCVITKYFSNFLLNIRDNMRGIQARIPFKGRKGKCRRCGGSFNILLQEKRYKLYSISILDSANNRRHNIEIYAVIRAISAIPQGQKEKYKTRQKQTTQY